MISLTPFLMFSTEAEEAFKFYVSLFKNSQILKTTLCNSGNKQIIIQVISGFYSAIPRVQKVKDLGIPTF